jgi:branched-chain amino acid transport system substrate-binding protein
MTKKLEMKRRSFLGGAVTAASMIALGAPAIAQRKTVHFGASLPLSGPYEKVSKVYKDAYDLWTQTVGGKIVLAGQEADVKWTVYDDENKAARTAELTERLITTDKVDCIVGTYGTDTVLAQGAIARKYSRITVQAGAASARVDEQLGGQTTFTLIGPSRNYPTLAIDLLAQQNPKPKTMAIITMDDPVYQEFAAGAVMDAERNGIKVVLNEVLPMTTQDLRPTVLKIKRAGDVDIIYNTGWDLICIKLIQECAALDVNPKAIMGGHLTTNAVVKETLKGQLQYIYGITNWLPQMAYKDKYYASCQAFNDKFQTTFGYAPTYHAAMAYTIPYIYQQVLADGSSGNPLETDTMRKRIAALNDMESIWGPIKFNDKGRILMPGLPVLQWQGADPKIVVLAPPALANGKSVYPMPPFNKRG